MSFKTSDLIRDEEDDAEDLVEEPPICPHDVNACVFKTTKSKNLIKGRPEFHVNIKQLRVF